MSAPAERTTVVIGASPEPSRYSYLATQRLLAAGYPVIPLGKRSGSIGPLSIRNDKPALKDVDTVTLYINPTHQREWYDYLLTLHPRRIIFNPGTENDELRDRAEAAGIHTEYACTLVLLSTRAY